MGRDEAGYSKACLHRSEGFGCPRAARRWLREWTPCLGTKTRKHNSLGIKKINILPIIVELSKVFRNNFHTKLRLCDIYGNGSLMGVKLFGKKYIMFNDYNYNDPLEIIFPSFFSSKQPRLLEISFETTQQNKHTMWTICIRQSAVLNLQFRMILFELREKWNKWAKSDR